MSGKAKQHTKDLKKHKPKIGLSAEELHFSRLVAKGISPTTAYRRSFPKAKDQAYGTVRNKAYALMANNDIVTEVATVKERSAYLVRIAEDRIEDILLNDNSQAKGNKVAEVAMFMYDHANGKATQRIEQTGKFVTVNMNLAGSNEPIPNEIIEQLKDD